ncbi:4Fe-4S dicluster domain-containing protein [Desulfobacula toluolica]|uniref:Putative 4Fe-4S ferredoxin n=1 Tax=Desulfobacula toluolica (strain DSM 7467 / Tol2) TaxID=651182 RepID=K0NFU0_DESTT|nr:4Fe-4S dicluster domain-containing protein [Desulfobacula toluolica]CCK78598.1 putative 4Fe-4S ferredoxin [Desulfobacula toluolica Tol2]
MRYFQVNDQCNGCLACVQNCPANALRAEDGGANRVLSHNMARCARCGNCYRICPQGAIEFQFMLENGWDEVKSLELVYCSVCGVPIYTVDYRRTLSEKLGKPSEPVCSKHRDEVARAAKAHFLKGRSPDKGGVVI